MRRLAFTVAVFAAMTLLVAPAFAAKGGEGQGGGRGAAGDTTSPTIVLIQTDPHLGGGVNFATTYGSVRDARVQVVCRQGGETVYAEAGWAADTFVLGGVGSIWDQRGGSADCVADLYYWDWHGGQTFVGLASTTFTAAGA